MAKLTMMLWPAATPPPGTVIDREVPVVLLCALPMFCTNAMAAVAPACRALPHLGYRATGRESIRGAAPGLIKYASTRAFVGTVPMPRPEQPLLVRLHARQISLLDRRRGEVGAVELAPEAPRLARRA